MSNLEKNLYEGNRAREVLESDVFKDAFKAIEVEVLRQWESSPARDTDGRERLWIYLHMLRRVKLNLEETMRSGQLASLELEHKRSMMERAQGWLRSNGT